MCLIAMSVLFGANHIVFASDEYKSPYRRQFTENGISIEFQVDHVVPTAKAQPFRSADEVMVSFTLSDATTGSPLQGVFPAAWMDLLSGSKHSGGEQCHGKVAKFVSGGTFGRAELDLNVYYVLALNADNTISVVDPLFGFGGSKLLALVQLASPGQDWVLTEAQDRLFVSLPKTGQIADIAAGPWQVSRQPRVGLNPMRIALQPDEAYLWVALDNDDVDSSGVIALHTEDLSPAATIRTGLGHHEIAFSPDNRFVFVTNQGSGTVSVIDVTTLTKIADLDTGEQPVAIAYSEQADAVYVANQRSGTITAIAADSHEILAHIKTDSGVSELKITPNGRLALAVNPTTDGLIVIDTATNQILQNAVLDEAPYRISFTDELAYVAHRDSETVLMIPLDGIGHEGKPIPLVDFPGGHSPLGATSMPSLAPGIVQASGEYGVLVANPTDHAIYFYKEGMAAPMGNFSNYGREPRAVLVVERNLQEKSPGRYQTLANLRSEGEYEVAFLLDVPRAVLCFPFRVEPSEASQLAHIERYRVEPISGWPATNAQQLTELRYRLTVSATNGAVYPPHLHVLVFTPGATWQNRQYATHLGNGVYSAAFSLPQAGEYHAYLDDRDGHVHYKHNFTHHL